MKNTNEKISYGINSRGVFGRAAVILMLVAAVSTLISSWGMWTDKTYAVMMIILPIGCNVLFALCVLLLGKRGFFLSVIPMLIAVVSCIFEATYLENVWMVVGSIALCAVLLLLYAATVWGILRSKWLLPPVFAGVLAFLIARDIPRLADKVNPVTFSEGMREIAMLCSVAGLLCISLGLRRNRRDVKPETEEAETIAEPDNTVAAAAELPADTVTAETQSDITEQPQEAENTPQESENEAQIPQEQPENTEEQPQETVNEKQ